MRGLIESAHFRVGSMCTPNLNLPIMKSKLLRSFTASLCCLLVGCANPYLAQMDALEADYRAGRVSRSEYNREMESLRIRSNQWNAQNSANAALGASAISAAAIVGGALIQAEATEDLAHAVSHKGGGSKGGGSKGGGSKGGGSKGGGSKGGGSKGGGSKGKPDKPSGGGKGKKK